MEVHLVFWTTLFCVFSVLLGAEEDWTHYTVLDGDGRFHLYWTPPEVINGDSEITFKVEVQAHGYVAFGLSSTGGMIGGDLVTGWVKGQSIYFQDRYSEGYFLPKMDKKSDWNLIEGSENDTHTILKFRRKLDTCDEEDMIIDDSTIRIIYAYSDKDPESDDPMYHYDKRGTKSAMLLRPKVTKPLQLDDPELLQWDIRYPNFTIPPTDTTYWCKIYKTPDLSVKHHIVYVKPIIDEGHEEFVHHMLLYECVGATPEEYDPYVDFKGHQCHRPNMPDAMKKCEGVSIAWAVGGADVVFPEHVGLPIDPVPGQYFMMELHYDNKQMKEGIVDSSGLRIYYTPKLRQFDAGCLMVGSTVSPRAFIPPGQKEYTLTGHSNPDCLKPDMPDDGIKVIGVLLHSHLIGKKLIARHFRRNVNDSELPVLSAEKSYDFNYQEYRYFKKEVEILPDDQITVECTYDSSNRSTTTFGGESTREEMCLAFILYYPRMDRYASLSVPTLNAINAALETKSYKTIVELHELTPTLTNFNWDSVDIRHVEYLTRLSKHDSHCYLGNGVKNTVKSLISYPRNVKYNVWNEKSDCEIKTGKQVESSGSILETKFIKFCILIYICWIVFNGK